MNTCLEILAEKFKPFLLKDIVIRTDKKIMRKGRLKIFQLKQYYIRLFIEVGDKTKQYEIPYPFDINNEHDNILTLNYHLSTLIKDDDIELQTKLLDVSNKSKIYNNLLYVLTSDMNDL